MVNHCTSVTYTPPQEAVGLVWLEPVVIRMVIPRISMEKPGFFNFQHVLIVQGLVNVPIEHHPTIGDIISKKYLKVMFKIPKKKGHLPFPDLGKPPLRPRTAPAFFLLWLHVGTRPSRRRKKSLRTRPPNRRTRRSPWFPKALAVMEEVIPGMG